ncbi:MAG: AMP-binding protein [Pseudomonadota bacterium]
MIKAADHLSVYSVFSAQAQHQQNADFICVPAAACRAYSTGEIRLSYATAKTAIDDLIKLYVGNDVTVGSRVAIAFDARADVYLHLLALNAVGASLVPLNMDGSDEEIHYVIGHSDACCVHGADEHLPRLTKIAATVENATMLNSGRHGEQKVAETDPSQEAALLYTSGTTGKPKACMLSNEYFLRMGDWYNELGGSCALESTDRLLTPLPPNHMNALVTSFMGMLVAGGAIIQLDRFHPKSWWQTVREQRASIIHYLGVMPAILLKLPERDDENFSEQLKFGFGAGSDPRHQAIFEERFGFPLIEAWAMTESGAGGVTIAHKAPRHVGKRCIGKPVSSMEYRLVDENDVDVAPGAEGELLVRSRGSKPRAGFFSGYYKDIAATEEGWKGDWWHTGDVVRADDEGSLFFVDRRKNVIRRSGENIAAVEVEAALLREESVLNCAVCAVPDEIRGDEVFALIVPSGAANESVAGEIFESLMQRLAYFKVPGYIHFTDALPLTPSQKVKRGVVKTEARALVDAGNAFDFRSLKKRRKLD